MRQGSRWINRPGFTSLFFFNDYANGMWMRHLRSMSFGNSHECGLVTTFVRMELEWQYTVLLLDFWQRCTLETDIQLWLTTPHHTQCKKTPSWALRNTDCHFIDQIINQLIKKISNRLTRNENASCSSKCQIKGVFKKKEALVGWRRLLVLCVFTGSKLRTSYGLYSWYSLSSLDTLYASSRNTAQPNNKAAFLKMANTQTGREKKKNNVTHKHLCSPKTTSGLPCY